MKELYNEGYELLNKGESFALATLYNSKGSAPRTAGARMIVKNDNSIIGTVGGGYLEALVIKDGGEVLKTRKAIQKDYKLSGEDKDGIDMVCGGDVSVLVEYIDANNSINLDIYKEIINYVDKGEKGFLVKRFNDKSNNIYRYLVGEDNIISEHNNKEELKELIKNNKTRDIKVLKEEDGTGIIEPICNSGIVYIFGAGHVSQKLADITSKIDFKTVVIDDRIEFANKERFPMADEIKVINDFDTCFDDLDINKDSYIVIVTRGHLHDLTILRQSLRTDATYIGMIGSKRKRKNTYKALELDGFSRDDFNRVYNPIGLSINAETPEEIAVSIAAELIKVRGDLMK
ncbi:XdhC family aldehyde oxidoreductase maturation factor [Tepidibacter aestuarii]|uniref:XdhC family aldehyde oxidoreductase maturation factor n=1 Tax=Tepidibacter aestuarii TaxID=2925782 RepID=UPI0020C09E64|nr:XdhC/CoxI family protein [Tepidibacter aestuarii]CAH2213319.1 xanthine dehydrogenase accessory factor [Tepidibacter aestuarii]